MLFEMRGRGVLLSSFAIVGVNQRSLRFWHAAGFQPRFQIYSMKIRGYKPLQQRCFVTIECLCQNYQRRSIVDILSV